MKCTICGREMNRLPYTTTCSDKCFHIEFWNDALDDEALIVNGKCYHAGPENSASSFRGFGGAKFFVRMLKDTKSHKAGELFISTNMWYQGEVPEDRNVEDNAEFISKSEYEESEVQ